MKKIPITDPKLEKVLSEDIGGITRRAVVTALLAGKTKTKKRWWEKLLG